ncbi:MAG: hypothetical protein HND51_10825 [Chloroflexi bacterium]|nr:hypothetical protein [Chloroflexota bacterium]
MAIKFSLQPVLDYRHNIVDALEILLSRLLVQEQQAKEYLIFLEQQQTDLHQQLAEMQSGEINMDKLNHTRANLQRVLEQIEQQKHALEELKMQVQAKRNEVTAAKQDEEVLLKLKQNQQDEVDAKQAAQEAALQDDLYIAKAFRQSLEANLGNA